jgi:hypothetical protein
MIGHAEGDIRELHVGLKGNERCSASNAYRTASDVLWVKPKVPMSAGDAVDGSSTGYMSATDVGAESEVVERSPVTFSKV